MTEAELSTIWPDVATATPTREQAYGLVYEQYLAKGYTRAKDSGLWVTLFDGLEDTTTLVIERDGEVVRTLTLVPDGTMGLPADDLFRDLLDDLRAQGRLGEVSAFAVNPTLDGRIDSALALINAAMLLGLRHGLTHFVITVHPRHAGFYRRGLGFEPVGEVRSYDKVDGAPARLLVADLKASIKSIHGRKGSHGAMFHRFWTPDHARRTAVRLVDAHRPMSVDQLHHFFMVKTPLWRKASTEWQETILGGRTGGDLVVAPDQEMFVPPPKHVVVAKPAGHKLLDEQTFSHLVGAAVRSPSADNRQPWAFGRLGDDLEVYYVRGRALKSDVRDLFGLIALGACIESIVLEAGALGLSAELHMDDDRKVFMGDRERIARVRLKARGDLDPLVRHLTERRTDRRLYTLEALTDEEIETLTHAVSSVSTRFELIREREDIERAARLVALADRIRFETEWLYDELRSALRLESGASTGVDVRSLGLPMRSGYALPWLGPWSRMRVLNLLGASLLAGTFARQQITHSGALGMLSLDLDSDLGKLTGGRDLLRVWLAAQSMGLSVQPVGALPLLLARVYQLGGRDLAPEHVERLNEAQKELDEIFGAALSPSASQRPALLLRLGRPESPPDAPLSGRLPPEDVLVMDEEKHE